MKHFMKELMQDCDDLQKLVDQDPMDLLGSEYPEDNEDLNKEDEQLLGWDMTEPY